VRVGDSRRGDDAVPHRPSAGIIKYRVNLPESASKVRRLSSSILNAISKISRAHPLFGWPRTRESSPHSDRRGASFFNPPGLRPYGGVLHFGIESALSVPGRPRLRIRHPESGPGQPLRFRIIFPSLECPRQRSSCPGLQTHFYSCNAPEANTLSGYHRDRFRQSGLGHN